MSDRALTIVVFTGLPLAIAFNTFAWLVWGAEVCAAFALISLFQLGQCFAVKWMYR